MGNTEGLHRSRGYLPHYEEAGRHQIVTFRLLDSLPSTVLAKFTEQLKDLPAALLDAQRRSRIEQYLDSGTGSCWLADAVIAQTTEQALRYFDGQRYRLHAWVVMPNHVHALLTPSARETLSSIIHSWKSFTAKRANAILGREGAFWQREYFDRTVRNEKHFYDAIIYIHNNPLKAGLCADPTDWQFSSARLVCM